MQPQTMILWSTGIKRRKRSTKISVEYEKNEIHLPPLSTRAKNSSKSQSDFYTSKKFTSSTKPANLLDVDPSKTHLKPGQKLIPKNKVVFNIKPPAIKYREYNIKSSKWIPEEHPLKFVDKKKIEDILSKAPQREKTTLQNLMDFFKKFEKDLNDAEKAFLIFRWHALNIAYNLKGLYSGDLGDNSAEGVFKNGMSVCAGYSQLYATQASMLGLKVEKVSGSAKTLSMDLEKELNQNHAWNAVEIKGKWWLIDATWGAGSENGKEWVKRYNEYHFCPNPADFIRTHFPADPKWQLIDTPISKETYMKFAFIMDEFFQQGLKKITPDTSVLRINDPIQITIELPNKESKYNFSAILSHFGNAKKDTPLPKPLVKIEENKAIFDIPKLENGIYDLILFAGPANALTMHAIGSYKVRVGPDEIRALMKKASVGKLKANRFQSVLLSPVGPVKKNEMIEIKVRVKNAQKVAVFIGKRVLNQLIVKCEEDIYQGKILMENSVTIKAQEKGSTEYKEIHVIKIKRK